MLSHGQNSRALGGRRFPDSGEAQSRERVKFIKILPVLGKSHQYGPMEQIVEMIEYARKGNITDIKENYYIY
jgi:hypothetical protein